jgi:5-methylcytosine-specific restriction endonuclease McrBC regulatory subunit McrC
VVPWHTPISQANLHQFQDVSLRLPDRHAFDQRHYHRLNDDYRLLHGFCRLFLENSTISERVGGVAFKGFLLDMNKLYEDFVTQAFLTAAQGSDLFVKPQDADTLSVYPSLPVRIKPDITVRSGEGVVAVVDAKYKRTEGMFENHDFYQMVAYGTALACSETYLVYPSTEWTDDRPVAVKNSPITIYIRRFDLSDPRCVDLAEAVARDVLTTLKARARGMAARPQPQMDFHVMRAARQVVQ